MRVLALLAITCLVASAFAMTETEVQSTVEKVLIIKTKILRWKKANMEKLYQPLLPYNQKPKDQSKI